MFYVHVWWIHTRKGVGKWSTLGVIQTFITCFDYRPILNSSATWQTSLFTLLQWGRRLKVSPIGITPLRRIMQPLNCSYKKRNKHKEISISSVAKGRKTYLHVCRTNVERRDAKFVNYL